MLRGINRKEKGQVRWLSTLEYYPRSRKIRAGVPHNHGIRSMVQNLQ